MKGVFYRDIFSTVGTLWILGIIEHLLFGLCARFPVSLTVNSGTVWGAWSTSLIP